MKPRRGKAGGLTARPSSATRLERTRGPRGGERAAHGKLAEGPPTASPPVRARPTRGETPADPAPQGTVTGQKPPGQTHGGPSGVGSPLKPAGHRSAPAHGTGGFQGELRGNTAFTPQDDGGGEGTPPGAHPPQPGRPRGEGGGRTHGTSPQTRPPRACHTPDPLSETPVPQPRPFLRRLLPGGCPRPFSGCSTPFSGTPPPQARPRRVTWCRTACRRGASSASACGPSMGVAAGAGRERSGAAGGQARRSRRRSSEAGRALRGGSGMERRGAPPYLLLPPLPTHTHPHDEIPPGVKPVGAPPPHFPHG